MNPNEQGDIQPLIPPDYSQYDPPPAYDATFLPPGGTAQQQILLQLVSDIDKTVSNFGNKPISINCPSCKAHVTTEVVYEVTSKTHKRSSLLFALFIILNCYTIFVPCCWVPYVLNPCKTANHFCPACNHLIGVEGK